MIVNLSGPPDYILKAINRETGEKVPTRLGAAWNDPDGTITLRIDRFVQLPNGPAWVFKLFARKGRQFYSGGYDHQGAVDEASRDGVT